MQRQSRAVVVEAAGAGVHGGEHEAGGKGERTCGAGNADGAVFERLAHDFEDAAGEFRELVEEQHSVVSEGDLAGARDGASADESRVGDGVVRDAEGTNADQAGSGIENSGHAVDLRGSRASSNVSGGRMVGMRLASMVLPELGEPIIRMLCPPAQPTSMARLAVC